MASGKWGEDLERTPPWDAERVSDALNRAKSPRQRAVITTTECKSHVVPSRKPLITLIDEVTTTAAPNRKKRDSSPFLARTQAMKSHGLWKSPLNLFPSIKALSSPGTLGTYTLLSTNADLKLPFSDDSEYAHLCWKKIFDSLFVQVNRGNGINRTGNQHGRFQKANYPLDTSEWILVSGWSDAGL